MELRLSEVLEDNETKRIDSEFFKKEYVLNDRLILKYCNGFYYFKDAIKKMAGGATPLGAEYQEIGIPFLRVQNIMKNYFSLNDVVYISSEQDKELKRSKLKLDDVLLTITGVSYGKSAVVYNEIVNSNINQHSVRIEVDKSKVLPSFVSTFLNSKNGKLQADRNVTGVTRPALDYEAIKKFKIPVLSTRFQIYTETLVKSAHEKLEESKKLYREAEELLLEELGLKDFELSRDSVAVKSFADSFGTSGRLDAEYYQPKYDDIITKIKSYKCGWKNIRDVLSGDIKNGTTPDEIIKEYIPDSNYFLRAEAFNDDLTMNYESLYSMGSDTFKKYKNISATQNDILVSMTGTIGNVAVVDKKINAIINQNIVKLTANKEIFNHYVLALYIKTTGKQLLVREQTGNVQPYVNIPNFSNLIVPLLDGSVQSQIEVKINESFKLRSESKNLLEQAKKALEDAIEKGEENV